MMKPETEQEKAQRHAATISAYRSMVDPAAPPKKPFLLEHRFFSTDDGDVTALTGALEEKGFRIDTVAYNPDDQARAWGITAVKLDLLEEARLLALSDDLDALARQCGLEYDGWLTRVE